MNIFVLDKDPTKAARYHCDKHVVKMALETAQILSTVSRVWCGDEMADADGCYRATHRNHPCVQWASESSGNAMWLCGLGLALSSEYTHRYGKVHKSAAVIEKACDWMCFMFLTRRTPFVQCMPDKYKCDDPVQAYRAYYLGDKAHMLSWKNREVPEWAQEKGVTS
jgi:hypothetical protein